MIELTFDLLDLLPLLLPALGIVWAPRTWTPGELVTASNVNTHIRDHLNALRATQATTLTGVQNDFALDGPFVYLLCSNTSRVNFNGILASGGNVDGARIVIEALTEEVVLENEATGSTSSNRILTPDGQPARIRAGTATSRAMLLYDGTALRWRVSLLTTVSVTHRTIVEEFLGLNITSGEIGAHGWETSLSGSGLIAVGGDSENDSIKIVDTGTTSASVAVVYLRQFAGDWQEVRFLVRPRTSIADVRIHIGMVEAANVANMNEDHDGAFFSFDPAQSANWRTITRNSATKTGNNSSVAVTLNNWYLLEMRKKGTDIEFLINDTVAQTHTTNLPLETLTAWTAKYGIINTAAASKIVDAGYFHIIRKLKQRYT